MQKRKFLRDLWLACALPPEELEQVGRDINMSICKSVFADSDTKDHGMARRGCGDVWARVKDRALLYATVEEKAWKRVRKLGPRPPKGDGDRCLWLLAAAWRAVRWLDGEKLSQQQLFMVRRFVTNLKGGVASLPSGFVIEAEARLREDELERSKPAGPEFAPAQATETTYVH